MSRSHQLPIESLRTGFLQSVRTQDVVVSAPTGSGKSTQIPRWCQQLGRVLVVEPRRVACRSLAQRVAELEGIPLGERVGYVVRDERRYSDASRIVFATPGVVVRWFSEGASASALFDVMILDEFHERGLETDLLLALALQRRSARLVVMSATLEGVRLARHIDGEHLQGEGRTFDVDCRYLPDHNLLPDGRGLEARVDAALRQAAGDPGDVLVFLPGKAEIASTRRAIEIGDESEVLSLHGGLSLKEQARVFAPGRRRRVILATNVAETSLTIPGIGVVIDSGLVRRTSYFNGRGFLSLVPIARDSAEQRQGRAGRTAPGVCYRLWSRDALLEERTPPAVRREELSGLVLAATACGEKVEELPFLDPPEPYALEAARDALTALAVLDSDEQLTARGRRLFGLPLDAALGALLVEAESLGCLAAAVDLVAVLAVGRPLFRTERPLEQDDLRARGCDALASIRALREGDPETHFLHPWPLAEARRISLRLRGALGLPPPQAGETIPQQALRTAALRADPRCAYIARRRRGRVFWANGGTEIELARESAVNGQRTEAIAVLSTFAVGQGKQRKIVASCALPVRVQDLTAAGLGNLHAGRPRLERGTLVARIERRFAGQVIAEHDGVPEGELARAAATELFVAGRLFPEALPETRRRLHAAAMTVRLADAGLLAPGLDTGAWSNAPSVPAIEEWVKARFVQLGLESGSELSLLGPADLLPAALPEETARWLAQRYPATVELDGARYRCAYELNRRSVTLVMESGRRSEPPSLSLLPPFAGFSIKVQHNSRVWTLR